MRNRILDITRRSIPFVGPLKPYAGWHTNSVLLWQQLDFWFNQFPDGFSKPITPTPNDRAYKLGESWQEELWFSEQEFRTAFDNIGVRHKSKTEYNKALEDGRQFRKVDPKTGEEREFYYASYIERRTGRTWYSRNHELVDSLLDDIAVAHHDPSSPRTMPIPEPSHSELCKAKAAESTGNDDPQFTGNDDPQFLDQKGQKKASKKPKTITPGNGDPQFPETKNPDFDLYTRDLREIKERSNPPLTPPQGGEGEGGEGEEETAPLHSPLAAIPDRTESPTQPATPTEDDRAATNFFDSSKKKMMQANSWPIHEAPWIGEEGVGFFCESMQKACLCSGRGLRKFWLDNGLPDHRTIRNYLRDLQNKAKFHQTDASSNARAELLDLWDLAKQIEAGELLVDDYGNVKTAAAVREAQFLQEQVRQAQAGVNSDEPEPEHPQEQARPALRDSGEPEPEHPKSVPLTLAEPGPETDRPYIASIDRVRLARARAIANGNLRNRDGLGA